MKEEKLVQRLSGISDDHVAALANNGELSDEAADRMIENDNRDYVSSCWHCYQLRNRWKALPNPILLGRVQRCCNASNMAKRCLKNGGFQTQNDAPLMIGQLQILDVPDLQTAMKNLNQNKDEIIALCNSLPSTMIKLGGGCKRIETRIIETLSGPMLILHIIVDCRDAMGANAVNTMAELIAPEVERLTSGRVHLKILSNLAAHRLARVEATLLPKN